MSESAVVVAVNEAEEALTTRVHLEGVRRYKVSMDC